MECPEKMRSYMEALEEERRKILVFRRELPLCLDLVTQAIEACKHQLSGTAILITTPTTSMEGVNGQITECSEQNSMKGLVMEEFIPIKRARSSVHQEDNDEDDDDDDDGDELHLQSYDTNDNKKSNWLKSVQLWNPNPEATITPREDSPPPPPQLSQWESVLDGKANGSGFWPSPTKEKAYRKSTISPGKVAAPLPPTTASTSTSSSAERGGEATGKRSSSQRKQRSSWSADLHRRFVQALQQLGGPYAATPKQIRKVMKVEDLTNDEVKSHLQKYRLHVKSSPGQNHGNTQPPQYVVVGGIWMQSPQQQHDATAAATISAHGIYAPVAAPLPTESAHTQVVWPVQQKPRGLDSEARGSLNSTTTSSSGRTVTVC